MKRTAWISMALIALGLGVASYAWLGRSSEGSAEDSLRIIQTRPGTATAPQVLQQRTCNLGDFWCGSSECIFVEADQWTVFPPTLVLFRCQGVVDESGWYRATTCMFDNCCLFESCPAPGSPGRPPAPRPCATQADCSANQWCLSGECRAPGMKLCRNHADCGDDSACWVVRNVGTRVDYIAACTEGPRTYAYPGPKVPGFECRCVPF